MKKKIYLTSFWLFAILLMQISIEPDNTKPSLKSLEILNLDFKGWKYQKSNLTVKQDLLKERINNAYDQYLLRTYIDKDGFEAEVQIFYCNSRLPRNRLTALMNMVNCLHGHFYFFSEKDFTLYENNHASMLYLGREGRESIVMYWLQSAGKTSTSGTEHLRWQYKQNLQFKRTDGCFVKVAYYGIQTPEKNLKILDLSRNIHKALAEWLKDRANE